MYRIYENSVAFYISNTSTYESGYLSGSWIQSSMDTEEGLCFEIRVISINLKFIPIVVLVALYILNSNLSVSSSYLIFLVLLHFFIYLVWYF
jgi:hypothetical protein